MLSALTNVATSVLVVNAAGAKAFDAFAVVFLLFATMIGIERALVGQPLGIRHSGDVGEARRTTVSRALGVVVGITVPASLLMLAAGAALGGRVGQTLMATSAILPFLILQDACRYAFFAFGQAKQAALNDALWAVLQFSAMGLLVAGGLATAVSLVLAWGGAAAVCVLVAVLQFRAFPRPLATVGWLREHRALVPYFLGEYLLTTGAFNGGYLAVGAIIGDQAVGSIRAAQVLLGPLQIVAGAGMSFGLPELSRRAAAITNRSRWRIALVTTTGMALLSLAYTGLLYLVPDGLGTLLFRDKWYDAQTVLLPLALAMIASTSALGPSMVIYALGLARRTFRIMTIEAPLVFTLMIGGSVLSRGVTGAAWGQFIDQVAMIVLWYGTLRHVLAESQAASDHAHGPRAPHFSLRQGIRLFGGPARRRYGLLGGDLELNVHVDGVLSGAMPATSWSSIDVPTSLGRHVLRVNLMARGQLLHQRTARITVGDEEWIGVTVAPAQGRYLSRREPLFALSLEAGDRDPAV